MLAQNLIEPEASRTQNCFGQYQNWFTMNPKMLHKKPQFKLLWARIKIDVWKHSKWAVIEKWSNTIKD